MCVWVYAMPCGLCACVCVCVCPVYAFFFCMLQALHWCYKWFYRSGLHMMSHTPTHPSVLSSPILPTLLPFYGPKNKRRLDKRGNNKQRGRVRTKQFYKDFQSSDFLHTKRWAEQHKRQRVIFALAMHWDHERDRLRLQSVENLFPSTKIISVSECEYTLGNMQHISVFFNDRQGLKSIAHRIQTELKLSPDAKVSVLLDYYWFQAGYYTSRYGLKWLESYAHTLLVAGAHEVLLPYDKGTSGVDSGQCDMDSMLNSTERRGDVDVKCIRAPHPDIDISFCDLSDNILWVGSAAPAIASKLASLDVGCNTLHTKRFLHPKTPFVRVMLKPT